MGKCPLTYSLNFLNCLIFNFVMLMSEVYKDSCIFFYWLLRSYAWSIYMLEMASKFLSTNTLLFLPSKKEKTRLDHVVSKIK